MNMLDDRYIRTDAGKAEIRASSQAMTRPARNLLLMLDASCSGRDWLRKVRGSTESDLDQLLAAGLVAPASAAKAEQPQVSVEEALLGWTQDSLYALLTREAKQRFGLIKGFRLVLKIESCATPEGLRRIALEFVERIRAEHGEDCASRFRRHLGATR